MLFGMGIRPFKIEVKLPNQVSIMPKDVNNACFSQGVTPLPAGLADGVFKFIIKVSDTRIYCYQFRTRVGCRAVLDDIHGRLPILIEELLEPVELLKYRTHNHNVHGLGHLINDGDAEKLETVNVKDGKVFCTYSFEQRKETVGESTVQQRMLHYLNQSCGSWTASITPKSECLLSQFSGGGDILIQLNSENSLLTLGGSCGEHDDEDTEKSPVYSDEVRSGPNIELKHKPREDVKHIELQLRANMILCLARQLDNVIEKYSLEDLTLLNTMSIYGVTFGYRSLHLLLKLTVNFKNQTTITQVRYKSLNSVPWAIEASVAYILSKMEAKAKSVAATTPTTTPTPPPT